MSPGPSDTGWQPLRRVARRRPDAVSETFVRLALTHALVMAGDAMVTVALAGSLFFSISPHEARGKVALSLLFTMLPFGVVAPFLGPAIDRSRGGRRLMLLGASAGRAITALIMAREIHSLLLFPAALALLILSKTHAVVKAALVPHAVRSADDLVQANGRLAMLSAIVGFVAAAPAAGILKLFGGRWVLRLAAVVYAAGAVAALRLRPAPASELIEPHPPEKVASLSRNVTLAATVMAVLRAVVGFLTFGIAFEFRRTHAPSWWFGIVLAASLLGGFAGAVVGPRLRDFVREERILGGAVFLVTFAALVAGWLGSRFGISLLALTVGVSAGTARLAFDAIVQRDGAEAARGRSFARFEATFQLVWVGAGLIPVVASIPNSAMCFVLALSTGMAGMFFVTGRRALRQLGEGGPGRAASPRGEAGRPGAVAADTGPAVPPPSVPSPPSAHPREFLGPGGVRWADDDVGPER